MSKSDAARLRHMLDAAGYFDVDLDIVWQIIANDLPPLIPQLESIAASLQTDLDRSG